MSYSNVALDCECARLACRKLNQWLAWYGMIASRRVIVDCDKAISGLLNTHYCQSTQSCCNICTVTYWLILPVAYIHVYYATCLLCTNNNGPKVNFL